MSPSQTQRALKAAVLLTDGFHLSSLGAFVDSIAASRHHIARQFAGIDLMTEQIFDVITYDLVSLDRSVRSSGGVIVSTALLDDCPADVDLIFMPAVADAAGSMAHPPAVQAWIEAARCRGVMLAASGASLLPLAQAGHLRDRTVSASERIAVRLKALDASVRIIGRQAHEDGELFSSAGIVCDPVLIALIVARLVSKPLGDWLARRCSTTHPFSGDPYMAGYTSLRHDPVVASAEKLLNEHCSHGMTMSRLANVLGVSERTLNRRFKRYHGLTPFGYRRFLRVETAKRCLELFDMPRTAAMLGFEDVRYFRAFFRKAAGITPEQYIGQAQGRVH